ncbi:MAG TPA: MFS transporter [Methanocella sp.]|nr:MFS transporter [Methanocella sp.]
MLVVAEIINVFGTSIIRTFLAIYMFNEMHVPMGTIGIALCLTSLAGVVAIYAGGSIADAWGRKTVLVAGLATQVAVYVMIGIAIQVSVPFLALLVVLAMSSLVEGLYRSVPDAMIADVVEPGKRVEAFSLVRMGANLGWVIGPVLGGAMLLFAPFCWVFYVAAGTTSVYLLIARFELRETRSTGSTEKLSFRDITHIVRDRPFLAFALLGAFMIIPYQQLYTLLSVYSSDVVKLDEFWVGALFTLSGAMVVLFQYPLSLMIRNYRLTHVLALSALIFASGFAILAVSTVFFIPFVCMAVATVAEMIWSPATTTLQANMAPEDRRGRYFGFAGLFGSLGFALGPLLGGQLMGTFGEDPSTMWVIVGLMFVACAAGFLVLNRFVPEKANAPRKSRPEKEKKLEAPIKA